MQESGLAPTLHGRVTNAATGLGVVPASKRWRITEVTMNLDAVGGDATYAAAILRSGTYIPIGAHVAANGISVFQGEMMLQAGDRVTNIGDAGSTNGTCDMTATYQEYDA